ncbi:hypothetical protein ACN9MB_09075 [Dyella kyungheensis]|uniref:Bbp19 family protein n=1 Tax=Dyella kyungheensis TaxID=1242174 RepID=UPI003CF00832
MENKALDAALGFLRRRAHAYRVTFTGPLAEEVLADLAKFCRATESTFHTDARAHAVAEGRREVWLRLQHHLKLSDDELWKRYGQGAPAPRAP